MTDSTIAHDAAIHDKAASPATLAYEQRLQGNLGWALNESSRHFEEASAIFATLRKIAARLDELGIPYVVVGAMALFRHGLRRFTEDVDLLVRKDDLRTIHDRLTGLGYLPVHPHSKHLRDTEHGVRIEFLTTGDFPGDGKPKAVAFPDPAAIAVTAESIRFANVESLVEMKLASGMTGAGRMKDLADVQELIKTLKLPRDFSERLNPYVRRTYDELWQGARPRFVAVWPNERLDAATRASLTTAGVSLETDGLAPGHTRLVTSDARVAEQFGLLEETEYWPEGNQTSS